MKELIEEYFGIEKNIKAEIAEIEVILKGGESEQVKLESIKSILVQLADEIREARKERYYEDRTGLLVSKFGEDFITREIETSCRYGKNFSIALLDVDFLKKINDKFGHVNGTKVIIDLADSIKKVLRKSDVASRYGGDEFLLIFPSTGIKKAKNAIVRLRKNLDERNKTAEVKLGFSAGLAEFNCTSKETSQELIARADKELYAEKEKRIDLNSQADLSL